jgi:DNA-binding NarL/FixJ family response regulator
MPIISDRPVKILVASPSVIIREGLRCILMHHGWCVDVWSPDERDADTCGSQPPSLVLLDVSGPQQVDLQVLEVRRRFGAGVKVLPVCPFGQGPASEDRDGALPGTTDAREIVRRVAAELQNAGASPGVDMRNMLSERELSIFRLLAEGKTNRGMAADLGVSVKTIESHKERMKRKLKLETNADLLTVAIRGGVAER